MSRPPNPYKLLYKAIINGDAPDLLTQWLEDETLEKKLPEIYACVGLEGGSHHDETVIEHILGSLEYAIKKDYKPQVRLACLLHDIGKPETYKIKENGDPSFHNHEVAGAKIAVDICKKMGLPKIIANYVALLVRNHMFNFDQKVKNSTKRRWLMKVGRQGFFDLINVRIADRKGNKKRRDQPVITSRMQKLIEFVENQTEDPSRVLFKTDINISTKFIQHVIGSKDSRRINQVYCALASLINEDPTRNKKKWLKEYLKRVYKND